MQPSFWRQGGQDSDNRHGQRGLNRRIALADANSGARRAIIRAVRFDDAFLDELKSRLRPSEVIGRTVKLRRQGREYVGLSPFSKERTPSFFVNDDKGRFFDFSSGKNGDLITFLQETERLSFVEAVERLAAEAGMALPAPDPQRRGDREEAHRSYRLAGDGGRLVRGGAAPSRRPRGARVPRPPRPAGSRLEALPAGLRAGRPHRAEGLPRRQGRAARRARRGRPADRAGGRRRALRPLPRPDHLPDRRARAAASSRSAAARSIRRRGPSTSTARTPSSSTRARALRPAGGAQAAACSRLGRARRWSWSRATWT